MGEFGLGEVWICYIVIGLNFIDIYFWLGFYFVLSGILFSFGNEGVGIV